MAESSRLQVLEHARELAERVGAVRNGRNYFETSTGECILPSELENPDDVCGVCIAGAILLARVMMGVDPDGARLSPYRELYLVEPVAVEVATERGLLNPQEDYEDDPGAQAITSCITRGGTEYVLAVLDRLIERERERDLMGSSMGSR